MEGNEADKMLLKTIQGEESKLKCESYKFQTSGAISNIQKLYISGQKWKLYISQIPTCMF